MITIQDIWEASVTIRDYVHKTPLVSSKTLSEMAGCEVWLKCENLQKTGSFKARGAFNAILHMTEEQKAHGVTCYSAGNHAQAVCYAAKQAGIKAYLYIPETASQSKVDACKGYGGEITLYGKNGSEVAPLCKKFSEEQDVYYIDPCEDPYLQAGQGTSGLEILEQLPDVDVVYVPCGGGGLMSGVSTAIKALSPRTKVIGVEPETANCCKVSFDAKEIRPIERQYSIADGLGGTAPGPLAFETINAHVDDMITVSDEEIAAATRLLMERCKQFVEPSGAASLAGLLSGKGPKGKKCVCLLSGGNVNNQVIADILTK